MSQCLDCLLAEQLVDVEPDAGADLSDPVDPGQIEIGQSLTEVGRLRSDGGEDEGTHGDHQTDHRQQGEDHRNRTRHPSLEKAHERLEKEDDAGSKCDREPDHPDRPGHIEEDIAEGNDPHRDPNDQGDSSQPF